MSLKLILLGQRAEIPVRAASHVSVIVHIRLTLPRGNCPAVMLSACRRRSQFSPVPFFRHDVAVRAGQFIATASSAFAGALCLVSGRIREPAFFFAARVIPESIQSIRF